MSYNPVAVQTDAERQAIKTAYNQAITDLQTIQNAASPTNAQVVWAVKKLAEIQEKLLRFEARRFNG